MLDVITVRGFSANKVYRLNWSNSGITTRDERRALRKNHQKRLNEKIQMASQIYNREHKCFFGLSVQPQDEDVY